MKMAVRTCVRYLITLGLLNLLGMLAAYAEEPPNFALKWGSQGTEDGQFRYAQSLVVDGAGNVWVADYTNIRIQKFSPEGAFLAKLQNGT
jgi:hypothetical protein